MQPRTYLFAAAALVSLTTETAGFVVPSDSDGHRRSHTPRTRALHDSLHATDVTGALRAERCAAFSPPPADVTGARGAERSTDSSRLPFTVGRHALDPALLSELNDPEVARAVMWQERSDTEGAPRLKTVPPYTATTVGRAATVWSSLASLPVAFMAFEQSAHSCTVTFWQQFVYFE